MDGLGSGGWGRTAGVPHGSRECEGTRRGLVEGDVKYGMAWEGERVAPWEWSYMDMAARACSSMSCACAAERE